MTTYNSKANDLTAMTLSALGLSHTLYFSMDYTFTKVPLTGWLNKFKKKTRPMDVDIACLLFDKNGDIVEKVWFKQLRDTAEAIRHKGDDIHGRRPGKTPHLDGLQDLEQIELRLDKVANEIAQIALIVNSYTGDPLAKLVDGEVLLKDDEANQALHINLLQLDKNCHTLLVANLKRVPAATTDAVNSDWLFIQQNKVIEASDSKKLDEVAKEVASIICT